MARRFVIIQPEWESYVGAAMSAGVEKFRRDRQDYNVAVDVRPYRQGEMDACAALLDAAAEEAPGHRPLRRRLSPDPVEAGVSGPTAGAGGDLQLRHRRWAAAVLRGGRTPRRAGRVAGDIAAKFLRPGDRALLV